MVGIPLGQRAKYIGETFEAIAEKAERSCEGCYWKYGEFCNAPMGAHLFDRCAANHVVYIKVEG